LQDSVHISCGIIIESQNVKYV